jgi:hypothetical protein
MFTLPQSFHFRLRILIQYYIQIKELLINAHLNKNTAIRAYYQSRGIERWCWKEALISCLHTIKHLEQIIGVGTELFQSEQGNTLILYLPGDHITFHMHGWTGITMGP